ncbi:TY4B-J, partial [Symbiodinium sp. CCMP2456]
AIQLDFQDMIANVGGVFRIVLVISQVPAREGSSRPVETPANPMEALMQGMSQLQAAMAMQMGMAASRPEVIKPGISGSELPKLPEADEQAAINVGDWLHGLAGPMGDLTDGSSRWWAEEMRALDAFYRDYVAASTVKKLQIRAEDYMTPELKDPKWVRLDKRAASMLLQAVPEGLRSELMANRLSSTIAILGRIITIYRPGSAAERQQVLRALENPGSASTAADLVEVLRRWMRWLKRAQAQMEKNGEIVFRSNMLRYTLDLDAAPTLPNIYKYHSHLLAEFEQNWRIYSGDSEGAEKMVVDPANLVSSSVYYYYDIGDLLYYPSSRLSERRMMAEQNAGNHPMPSMKMLQRAVTELEAKMALVDSGATHPLRQATGQEWECSNEVDVLIAGDGVTKMRQSEAGTLFTSPSSTRTQTILPVGGLVSILGYELIWTKRKCALRAPDGREIPLRVTSGCPEVNEATALELIARIEEEKVTMLKEKANLTRMAVLRAQQVQGEEQWEASMREYVAKGRFEDGYRALVSMPWLRSVHREDLVKIAVDLPTSESEAWELMMSLGFNRRMRKRLLHKDWIVKLYGGARTQADKIFRPLESNSTVVLD